MKDKLFPVPPLFRMIQEESGTSWKEMYQVFNMGHRFEIYTDEKAAEDMIEIGGKVSIWMPGLWGIVSKLRQKKLTIRGEQGEFIY